MTKPYSMDVRDRVVAAVLAGGSCRTVAERFSIGVSSVVRWSRRFRASGSAAARAMGGARHRALMEERGWLLERIAAKPDVTLRARVAELESRGVKVSYGAVWRFCACEGLSFKERRSMPQGRIGRTSPAAGVAGVSIKAS